MNPGPVSILWIPGALLEVRCGRGSRLATLVDRDQVGQWFVRTWNGRRWSSRRPMLQAEALGPARVDPIRDRGIELLNRESARRRK